MALSVSRALMLKCSRPWLWRLRDRQGSYPVLSAHTVPPPRISLSSFHLFQATVIIFGFSGFSEKHDAMLCVP